EEKRWTSEVCKRLPKWVAGTARPIIAEALAAQALTATMRVESEKLFIDYEATTAGSGYVAPSVMLEFGARSTGEPASLRDIACDASGLIEDVVFPTARPRVMHAERTFWEKAMAIHVFCLQARLRGDRFARHWHDVARLDEAGLAQAAVADRELANAVARHKGMFFAEKAADRAPIDYTEAINGGLRLVPEGDGLRALEDDYGRMVEAGLLLEDAESFEALMARCADIATRANKAAP
ncbi:MAG: nucleotidyl transferase AbiEii/AbiGii toxin family protein, partial [Alphaproteobacteria bacterium]|nr:nucleotidyl transferase AbiEii/AbiGii toxin family protein [Alphaproteobacteria bacterium]